MHAANARHSLEWYDRRPPGGHFRAVFIVGYVYVILARISDTLVV